MGNNALVPWAGKSAILLRSQAGFPRNFFWTNRFTRRRVKNMKKDWLQNKQSINCQEAATDVMNIKFGKQMGRLNINIFARCMFCVLLITTLIILLTGCEITDPDWQARDNMKTLQPTSPPPPRQWEFW
jgi:hypothetical protein